MLDEIDIKDYEKEIIEGKYEDIYRSSKEQAGAA